MDIRNVQEELLTQYYHNYVQSSSYEENYYDVVHQQQHSYGLEKPIKSEIFIDNNDFAVEPVINYFCNDIKSDIVDNELNDVDVDDDNIDFDVKDIQLVKKAKRKPKNKTSSSKLTKKFKSSTVTEKKKKFIDKKPLAVEEEISDPEGDEQIRNFFKMNCDVCSMSFDTFFEARTHYKIVHKQAGYITCCSKKYFRRSRALAHISKHITVKNFM